MEKFANWIGLGLLALAVVFGAIAVLRYWLGHRREQTMLRLLRGADALEADIKQCRIRLTQAHAAMSVSPELPSAGSADAQEAINNALRDLLQHRLWIRDQAPRASQAELEQAANALENAGRSIHDQLEQLRRAHQALDQAVRDHQHRT